MPNILIHIDAGYKGHSLIELESLLPLSNDRVVAIWSNTKRERDILRRYPQREVVLVVATAALMDRAATTLGLRFRLGPDIGMRVLATLHNRSGDWSAASTELGPGVTRGLAVSAAASYIQSRMKNLNPLIPALTDCVLDGLNIPEADLLMNLYDAGADPRRPLFFGEVGA